MSIHLDMSAADYDALPGLRSTVLREMLRSTPKQAREYELHGSPDSEAKVFGRLLHACVLEPERFERELAVLPEFKGVGSRALKAEWELRNAGKIQVRPKVLEQLLAMRDAVMKHTVAREMFAADGANEVSAVWDDPLGMRCKVRWDRIYSEGVLRQADLKSTRAAQEDFFRYDMKQYGYDVEACLYSRALDVLHGERPRPFHFVAVEKTAPHRVEVYELTKAERALGNQKMERAMRVYAECLRTNEWPDVPIYGAEERAEGVVNG